PSSTLSLTNTATSGPYTLSLHDALPIFRTAAARFEPQATCRAVGTRFAAAGKASAGISSRGAHRAQHSKQKGRAGRILEDVGGGDRKSTRLNSSHDQNSYAVFCLKKKAR